MHLAVPVIAAPIAMLATLVGSQASAFSFSFSNDSSNTLVRVAHQVGGGEFEEVLAEFESNPSVIDLGYASASSSAAPLSLSVDVDIDGSQTGSLGVDNVAVDAYASYHADVIFEGGVGTFLLRLSSDLSESASPGSLFGTAHWSITAGTFVQDPDGSRVYEAEYGVPYTFVARISANLAAAAGEDAWRSRTLDISFTEVPEPGAGVLLAFGLVVLSRRSRRALLAAGPGGLGVSSR